jgi:hypothetical protein
MEYLIAIFLLGLIVVFVVIVGLARAAEFARTESSRYLQIDPVPEDWNLSPEAPAETRWSGAEPPLRNRR